MAASFHTGDVYISTCGGNGVVWIRGKVGQLNKYTNSTTPHYDSSRYWPAYIYYIKRCDTTECRCLVFRTWSPGMTIRPILTLTVETDTTPRSQATLRPKMKFFRIALCHEPFSQLLSNLQSCRTIYKLNEKPGRSRKKHHRGSECIRSITQQHR